jgi:hypothetical protein
MGHVAGRRGEREGSLIGTRYRHMTAEVQARVAAVIEQQLSPALTHVPQGMPRGRRKTGRRREGQAAPLLTCAVVVVELRGFEPLTPCMPCSFGLLPHRRSGAGAQPNGLLRVTVIVRWIPLVTAAYGTWVARPARTTNVCTLRRWLQLGQRARSVLATTASWTRAQRARGSRCREALNAGPLL